MAECSVTSEKEFISAFNEIPHDIEKLEKLYDVCYSSPREMLLYLAKGDNFEANGEVEYAYHAYAKALYAYGEIRDTRAYEDKANYLKEQKEKYKPKTAEVITRGTIKTETYRGAELKTEYRIEDLPLYFQSDSSDIKSGVNEEQAEEIYKALSSKKYVGKPIFIMGFTDTSGSAEHNDGLSKRRAKSLKVYLKKQGLKNQISSDGVGEIRPICTQGGKIVHTKYEYGCSTKEDKDKSRRVTISIGDD